MFEFIKKFFAKEEKEEEKIDFESLGSWLNSKEEKTILELKKAINKLIESIKSEKTKLDESLKNLENAKLQNPNIPNRAKTVMEGNRENFIKKTLSLFDNLNLKYENIDEIKARCNELKKEIENIAKSTQRSYAILNEFFARELSKVSKNISVINNHLKDIENVIKESKLEHVKNLKNDLEKIKSGKEQKKRLSIELEEQKKRLEEQQNNIIETEKNIKEIKESPAFKEFEENLRNKENLKQELKQIEDKVFHDFSNLDKALKKYSKIAFENGKLIDGYLNNPLKALINDKTLEIVKVLEKMKETVRENKLDLDKKKNEKILAKLEQLKKEHFEDLQQQHSKVEDNTIKIEQAIKNNESKKKLDELNNKLNLARNNAEKIKSNIENMNNEVSKLDESKSKQEIQEKINNKLSEKIILN